MEEPKQKGKLDEIVKSRINGGNRRVKGRRSAPKAENRQTGQDEPYAYTFKDPNIGTMPVLNSANAWWLDATKLQMLISAYKFHATDDQACYYAGISRKQLEYFQNLHPDFYGIKHACKQDANLRARKRIVGDIDKDTANAWKWLERTEKETFSPRIEATGANGRDLIDGLTVQVRNMLLEDDDDDDNNNTEKHPGEHDATDADAGQDGPGDEAVTTETQQEASA